MRIAFLTTEFPSERDNAGGLATFVSRMAQALTASGEESVVFVISEQTPREFSYRGVSVVRVPLTPILAITQFIHRVRAFFKQHTDGPAEGPLFYLITAYAMRRAFLKAHQKSPFDVVHTTNLGTGILLPRLSIPHIVRLSSKRNLWNSTDGYRGIRNWLVIQLEKYAVRRADAAYAPSQFVADACKADKWRGDVAVIRPPVLQEVESEPLSPNIATQVPNRFLIHFGGRFSRRKGSDVIANALAHAWKEVPDLKMVWVGANGSDAPFAQLQTQWGKYATNIIRFPQLSKAQLYTLLMRAEAAVLPSRVDNLPNTVIESLLCGVPVIGSNGASINELVYHEKNGLLVPIGDKQALASAMMRVWRKDVPWRETGIQKPEILKEMRPERAAENLIAFIKHHQPR